MNSTIKLSLATFAIFFCTQSFSQYGRPSLSLGAELGVPAGTLNATQKTGLGGSAKAAFPVGSDLDITVTAGYISFSGDIRGDIKAPVKNFIPLKAGARYRFIPGGFYLEPQLGYTFINTPGNSSASGGFTYAANAGYIINNQWDISARYEAVSLKNNVNLPFAAVRLAYNFRL